jgi:hypothetical protein
MSLGSDGHPPGYAEQVRFLLTGAAGFIGSHFAPDWWPMATTLSV